MIHTNSSELFSESQLSSEPIILDLTHLPLIREWLVETLDNDIKSKSIISAAWKAEAETLLEQLNKY